MDVEPACAFARAAFSWGYGDVVEAGFWPCPTHSDVMFVGRACVRGHPSIRESAVTTALPSAPLLGTLVPQFGAPARILPRTLAHTHSCRCGSPGEERLDIPSLHVPSVFPCGVRVHL